MTLRRLVLVSLLAASAGFAQYCDKIDQKDADMVLGGQAVPLGLGMSGCSYSVKGKAMRLTLTLSDDPSAARNYTTLRKNAKGSAWLVADEQTLGLLAFSEFVKKPGQPVKVGFIVAKGTKLIQFYLTDSTGAAKRETVDKLRPIAKRVIDRI